MTFPIGGNDNNFNIGRAVRQGAEDHLKRALDPLNLFGGDAFGSKGASGLFPKGAGGSGGIEDILAALSKKDKNSSFDTNGAGDSLFSGGKDMGQGAGEGGPGGGAGGGAGQAIQAIMGIVQKILPMIMGMLGGL